MRVVLCLCFLVLITADNEIDELLDGLNGEVDGKSFTDDELKNAHTFLSAEDMKTQAKDEDRHVLGPGEKHADMLPEHLAQLRDPSIHPDECINVDHKAKTGGDYTCYKHDDIGMVCGWDSSADEAYCTKDSEGGVVCARAKKGGKCTTQSAEGGLRSQLLAAKARSIPLASKMTNEEAAAHDALEQQQFAMEQKEL